MTGQNHESEQIFIFTDRFISSSYDWYAIMANIMVIKLTENANLVADTAALILNIAMCSTRFNSCHESHV